MACLRSCARWYSASRCFSMAILASFSDSLHLPLSDAASCQVSWGIPDLFMFLLRMSLKRSFCPPWLLRPCCSSEYRAIFDSLKSGILLTCPAHLSWDVAMIASTLLHWALRRTSTQNFYCSHNDNDNLLYLGVKVFSVSAYWGQCQILTQ